MRLFWITFITVFLAELGDKTQLVALMLSAKEKRFWPIFLAAAIALTLASALGVAAGNFLGELLPLKLIRVLSGAAFILMGVLILWGKI